MIQFLSMAKKSKMHMEKLQNALQLLQCKLEHLLTLRIEAFPPRQCGLIREKSFFVYGKKA